MPRPPRRRHGRAIRGVLRRYMPQVEIREMDERRKQTLCCGAGGAVAGYDPDITKRRVMRVVDEAHSTGANMLVTMCPTCTYTIAPGEPVRSARARDRQP